MSVEELEAVNTSRVRVLVGITIGLGALGMGALNIANAPPEVAARPLTLILAPQVSFMLISAMLGFLSAASSKLGRLQVWLLYLNGLVTSALAEPSNLTSFILVLLAVLLAARYGWFDRRPRSRSALMLGGYAAVSPAGLIVVGETSSGLIVVRMFGTVVLGVLTWFILVLWAQERQQRETELDERVRRSTRDLRDALDKQQSLLEDQKTLLAELHHRTKNNLQIVSSILSLGAGRSDSPAGAQYRIEALGRIHDRLYASTGASTVDFPAFMGFFLNDAQSMVGPTVLRVTWETGDIPPISSELAIRVSLALNEIVSQAVFQSGTDGHLHVTARLVNEYLIVETRATIGPKSPSNAESAESEDGLVEALMQTVSGTAQLTVNEHLSWRLAAPVDYGHIRWD